MKKSTLVFLSAIFILSWVNYASAHTYITDGDITVLLHTNPNDDPVAGQPAALLFEITDSTNKFVPNECNCNLTISKGGQVLLSNSLSRVAGASVYDFTQPFTFPEQAVYQIAVTGEPKTAGAFQSFQVSYDLRVDQGTAQTAAPTKIKLNIWAYLAGLAVFAFIVGVVIYFKGIKRKRN